MEKRLFFKDPTTGTETPLLVYTVDTTAVSELQRDKQDKTDSTLDTSSKTIVGAINELNTARSHTMQEPYVEGVDGQVLTSDGDGGYAWTNADVSVVYDSVNQSISFKISK